MIPRIITDCSITFFARGKRFLLAGDHPNFETVKQLLTSGHEDEDQLVRLTDVRIAVSDATNGAAELVDGDLVLNGEKMCHDWFLKAVASPSETKILLIKPGDTVLVEGDEEAPDGEYTVGDVDDDDVDKRIFIESEDGFLGFVPNASIKSIVHTSI